MKNLDKIKLARNYHFLLFIMLLGVLFINVFSDFILKLFTTPAYYSANEFIPWISIGFMFVGLNMFLQPVLINGEKHKYISVISTINMAILVFLNIILSHLLGYIGIAMAFSFSAILQFLFYFIMLQKTLPLPWMKALKINEIGI